MFDHLETIVQQGITVKHKIALSAMMVSGIFLLGAFAMALVPINSDGANFEQAKFFLNSDFIVDRLLVGDQKNLLVASYNLDLPGKNNLNQLTLRIDGVYRPENFSSFKFYLDGRQIGQDVLLDDSGQVPFNFENLTIPAGSHKLDIRSDWQVLQDGEFWQTSVVDQPDLKFSNPLDKIAVFPVTSGLTSFTTQGNLTVKANDYSESPGIVGFADGQQFLDFPITVGGGAEALDLQSLSLSLTADNFKLERLEVIKDTRVIKILSDNYDNIYFTSGQVVLAANLQTELILRLYGQTTTDSGGEVGLSVREAASLGYDSGQIIYFFGPVVMKKYLRPDWPVLKLADSNGQSYRFSLDSFFHQPLNIKSLTFKIETDSSIENWQVSLNGQPQEAIFTLVGDKLLVDLGLGIVAPPGSYLEILPLRNQEALPGSLAIYLVTGDLDWSLSATVGKNWLSLRSLDLPPVGAVNLSL